MILCVDIGGTSTKAAALAPTGQLLFLNSIPTQPDMEPFFSALIKLIKQVAAQTESSQIGVAVAGFLNPDRTSLLYNPNIPWLEGFPLKARLQQTLPGLRIELEIDSNAATLAEHRFGSGQGKSRFLCLTCGTGLGVGMTIDGLPLRFAYGCMGDIGHLILNREGPLCTCGGRGCAEALLSPVFLAASYREKTGKSLTLREIITASQENDRTAQSVLETAGEWLGLAAASMANTFFPNHIAIAGGLSAAGALILHSAETVFQQTACTLAKTTTTFSLAKLGPAATLIGAGCQYPSGDILFSDQITNQILSKGTL